MTRTRSRRLVAAVVALSLAAAATAAIVPGVSAATTCRVKNLGTNVTKQSLQGAVNAAAGGATLQVTGTCVGGTTIDKNLTIIGQQTAAGAKPILDGDHLVRVVWVKVGRQVSIKSLTIRNGLAEGGYPANSGGGIRNDGTVTLMNVTIRGSVGTNGGGVSTAGRIILKGSTQIAYNHADGNNGGGVDVDQSERDASLVMNGTSSIHHNSANWGGGVHIWLGTMVMNDSASVHHNKAVNGAGISDQGDLTMNDASTVRANTVKTGDWGGGVEVRDGDGSAAPTFTMTGTSRVRDNTAGSAGAGVIAWPECGLDPVLSGVTLKRVIDNTPANKVVMEVC